jgi:hypothetical protein
MSGSMEDEEEESMIAKGIRKSLAEPLIPLGCAVTFGFLW